MITERHDLYHWTENSRQAIHNIDLGDIVAFATHNSRSEQTAALLGSMLGIRSYIHLVTTDDPQLQNIVVMRRPVVMRKQIPCYVAARLTDSPNVNRRLLKLFADKLRNVLENEPAEITLFEFSPSHFQRFTDGSCMPEPCCSKMAQSFSDNDEENTDQLVASIPDDENDEETLAEQRKEWEDRLSGLILEYVMHFRRMPSFEDIEKEIRGKISIFPSDLSSITVNSDMRIILPGYNEIELRMTPLARSLYILFLCHPEGIVLKYMHNYRDELRDIYLQVKPGADNDLADTAIDDIVAPFSDSLRQKLSMIKRAVNRYITDRQIAGQYTVIGQRGEAYRIPVLQHITCKLPAALTM